MSNRSITIKERDIRWTPEFKTWIGEIKDVKTRIRLLRRIRKLEQGLYGDVSSLGSGIFEMREFFGPGWRMYFTERSDSITVMLIGGDKSTQAKDIQIAKIIALAIKD
jgi:putative addiction module killer protein